MKHEQWTESDGAPEGHVAWTGEELSISPIWSSYEVFISYSSQFRYISLLNIPSAMPPYYRFSNSLAFNNRGWL